MLAFAIYGGNIEHFSNRPDPMTVHAYLIEIEMQFCNCMNSFIKSTQHGKIWVRFIDDL